MRSQNSNASRRREPNVASSRLAQIQDSQLAREAALRANAVQLLRRREKPQPQPREVSHGSTRPGELGGNGIPLHSRRPRHSRLRREDVPPVSAEAELVNKQASRQSPGRRAGIARENPSGPFVRSGPLAQRFER